MSGISYDPPLEQLAIFDPSVFIYDQNLSSTTSGGTFLNFPIAQGTETFIDLISNGTATLNTATIDNQLIATGPIVVADVFPAPTQTAVLTSSQLTFADASTTNTILLDDTQILLASTATPNSIDIKNNVMTLTNVSGSNLLTADAWTGNIASVNTTANLTHYLGFFDSSATGSGKPQKVASLSCNPSTATISATTFSGALSGNASSASSISLTSDNTSGAYFIPFSKTVNSTSTLFVDNSTTPLSYDPSTSRLACNEFSGDLLGNATTATNATSCLNITTTNDNANIAYNLVFCAGAFSMSNLLVDQLTGPLTYNPSTGDINTTSVTATSINAVTLNGEIRYSSGTSPNASFAGTTLTVLLNNVSIRTNTIIFTGGANTVTTLSLTAPRNNGIFYVGIRNNGTAGTSFLTGLGANILTKYSTTVVVPASSSALMTINIITINAIATSVVGIDLLT